MKMGLQNNSQESSSSAEEEEEEKQNDEVEEVDHRIQYKERVLKGSFMPAICMIKMGVASVEEPIDPN